MAIPRSRGRPPEIFVTKPTNMWKSDTELDLRCGWASTNDQLTLTLNIIQTSSDVYLRPASEDARMHHHKGITRGCTSNAQNIQSSSQACSWTQTLPDPGMRMTPSMSFPVWYQLWSETEMKGKRRNNNRFRRHYKRPCGPRDTDAINCTLCRDFSLLGKRVCSNESRTLFLVGFAHPPPRLPEVRVTSVVLSRHVAW